MACRGLCNMQWEFGRIAVFCASIRLSGLLVLGTNALPSRL
jgi:hypothetical protein